ncbi:glycine zipper 2TM domain-containing protein [uncultured Aquitalea sp.]|uniref:glycine zipper 2TM domain-containing protein n=1 Tax=uncultured Aquitalea sp. TaxID=540272 RepID=UPI0025ECBCDD|nr:glycine zipper 2TM domain-containing protein [uncultured Aquitalea sp.]
MKQSVLIASVLAGGVIAGGLGVAAYQSLNKRGAEAPLAQASAPAAQLLAQAASAPAALSSAASSPLPASSPGAQTAAPTTPKHASYAKVLSVKAITEPVTGSKEVCRPEQVTRQAPVQDENRVAGTVLGSVLGGVLGNQVGGGNGKKIATVVGAVAGGYAGNQVQQRMQQNDTVTATENRCNNEETRSEKVVGYQVRYSLDGKTGSVRMDHKPGKRIPARDGELLLN